MEFQQEKQGNYHDNYWIVESAEQWLNDMNAQKKIYL